MTDNLRPYQQLAKSMDEEEARKEKAKYNSIFREGAQYYQPEVGRSVKYVCVFLKDDTRKGTSWLARLERLGSELSETVTVTDSSTFAYVSSWSKYL